jgi:hypothetical protein
MRPSRKVEEEGEQQQPPTQHDESAWGVEEVKIEKGMTAGEIGKITGGNETSLVTNDRMI